jgi:predicted Fe-Mo cluster-binding NifX family protein
MAKRIAIPSEDGRVAAHFGRCPEYTILDISDGNLSNRSKLGNPGHEPGKLPEFLKQNGVDAVVGGGMGQRAIGHFSRLNIETILGISGSIDEIVKEICAGTLSGGESLCRKQSASHDHDCEEE